MTPASLPSQLILSATVESSPLPGAWFELELPMARKNNYRLPVGPADERGRFMIAGGNIADVLKSINDLFPMDYVGPAAGWTGEIRIRPVNRSAVQRLRNAHSTWGHTGIYPPGFTESLDTLAGTLETLGSAAVIAVAAAAEPGDDVELSTTVLPAQG